MWVKGSPILREKSGTLSEYWPQYLLAFLFPTLTVLAAFAVTGCYPFGERTILTVDLYHQYCPFLVAFRDKVLSGQSLFYIWNDGLGQEYYAAYANYAASPLICGRWQDLCYDARTRKIANVGCKPVRVSIFRWQRAKHPRTKEKVLVSPKAGARSLIS